MRSIKFSSGVLEIFYLFSSLYLITILIWGHLTVNIGSVGSYFVLFFGAPLSAFYLITLSPLNYWWIKALLARTGNTKYILITLYCLGFISAIYFVWLLFWHQVL